MTVLYDSPSGTLPSIRQAKDRQDRSGDDQKSSNVIKLVAHLGSLQRLQDLCRSFGPFQDFLSQSGELIHLEVLSRGDQEERDDCHRETDDGKEPEDPLPAGQEEDPTENETGNVG